MGRKIQFSFPIWYLVIISKEALNLAVLFVELFFYF